MDADSACLLGVVNKELRSVLIRGSTIRGSTIRGSTIRGSTIRESAAPQLLLKDIHRRHRSVVEEILTEEPQL
jgi:hypothetical protein